MKKRWMSFLLVLVMVVTLIVPATGTNAMAEAVEADDLEVTASDAADEAEVETDQETDASDEYDNTDVPDDTEEELTKTEDSVNVEVPEAPEDIEAEETDVETEEVVLNADEDEEIEYLYGVVKEMSYADFYYGELENIEPDNKTEVTPVSEDPVVAAGYTEEGMYDAATFATPKKFIHEQKWKTWAGTYSETITNEKGIIEGGKILGVTNINVAISKELYENAKKDASASVLNSKIAAITLNKDQSSVPGTYKVLNSNAVYTKYVNALERTSTLGGSIHTDYCGEDNWWEGSGFSVGKGQTILGGFVEWQKDPTIENSTVYRAGLKHEENIWQSNTIGWGVGQDAMAIYGDQVGWQRFAGISGSYVTKMTLIVANDDSTVTYQNATPGSPMLSPLLPSGIVEEDGSMPYNVTLSNYEVTADRILLDFTFDVPVNADGTPEVDYNLTALYTAVPSGSKSRVYDPKNYEDKTDVPVYTEKVEGGHKEIHIELNRETFSIGRLKYLISASSMEGRQYGRIYRQTTIESGLSSDEIYIQNNRLVIENGLFTADQYRQNPYQKIIVENEEGDVSVFTTGDSVNNSTLMSAVLNANGTFNKDATFKDQAVFEGSGSFKVTMYVSGYPIVQGTLSLSDQSIYVGTASYEKSYGDAPFKLDVSGATQLTYASDHENVAAVAEDGTVTIKGIGTANITITSTENGFFKAAAANVSVTVQKGIQTIIEEEEITKHCDNDPFKLPVVIKDDAKVTYSSSNPDVVTVDKNGTVSIVQMGTATITVDVAETEHYAAASKTIAITVMEEREEQTITVEPLSMKYGDTPTALKASSTSGLAMTYTSNNEKVAAISEDGIVTPAGVGEAVITITAPGNDQYKKATKTVTVTVGKGTQIITVPEEEIVKSYGAAEFSLGASAIGDAALTYASDAPGIVSISADGAVKVENVGSAGITITAAETDLYEAGTKVVVVVVEQKTQDFYLAEEEFILETTDSPYEFAYETESNKTPEITSGNPEVATAKVSDTGKIAITPVGVGKATITLDVDGTAGYTAVTRTITVTVVNPRTDQVITAEDITKTYRSEAFAIGATSLGNVPLTYSSDDETVAAVAADGTVTLGRIGTANITITAAATELYRAATKIITITVEKYEQEFIMDQDAYTFTVGDDPMVIAFETGTNKNPQFSFSNPEVAAAKVSGWRKITITPLAAGTTTITMDVDGTGTYAPVSKTITVTVVKKTQEVIAKSVTKTYGDKAFALGAASSANATLTYTSSDKKVVTVSSAGKVTIKGTGKAKITIDAAETDNYYAASKTVTITVKPKKVTISKVTSTKAKTAVVTWKKDSKATGYEMQYSTSKSFTSGVKTVKVGKNTTVSKTIKKLTSGKKYYVRVRAYKTVGSKKLYGAYSSAKSVTVK